MLRDLEICSTTRHDNLGYVQTDINTASKKYSLLIHFSVDTTGVLTQGHPVKSLNLAQLLLQHNMYITMVVTVDKMTVAEMTFKSYKILPHCIIVL